METFTHAGCEVAAYAGPPAAEYRAARLGAACIELPWRALLAVRGPDAVSFLQGMLTQDVAGMAVGQVLPACLVDRKGRLLADLWIRRREDGAVLDLPSDRLTVVSSALERHRILEDVVLEPIYPLRVVLLCGPRAPAIASELSLDVWPVRETGSWDLHVPVEDAAALLPRLREAGALPIGGRTLDRLRIEAGRPWFGRDMDENRLPMEVNLDEGISATKGCYIGQETIVRVRDQGRLNHRLLGVRVPGEPSAVGSEVRLDGRAIGTLSSVAPPVPPGTGDSLALALVRLAGIEGNEAVAVAGRPGRLERLPFREAR